MSVVIGAVFPEYVVILSDSRVTLRGKFVRDELQKIFQLGSHLVVGFTSNDVRLSYQIIEKITKYSLQHARSQHVLYLLDKLPKVAAHYYNEIISKRKRYPEMSFIYGGIVLDRSSKVPTSVFMDMAKRNNSSFQVTPNLWRAIRSAKDGLMTFGPSVSVLKVQDFPGNKQQMINTMGIAAIGSGKDVSDDLFPEFHKLVLQQDRNMRIGLLRFALKEYQDRAQVPTVGGMTQTLIVSYEGVSAEGYSFSQIGENGRALPGQKMIFDRDQSNWIQVDENTG